MFPFEINKCYFEVKFYATKVGTTESVCRAISFIIGQTVMQSCVLLLCEASGNSTETSKFHHDVVVAAVADVNGVRQCLWTAGTDGPIVHPPNDMRVCRATVEWYWQEKTEEIGRKNLSNGTLSTTNPTCTEPNANPSHRGERSATNRLEKVRPFHHDHTVYCIRYYRR